MPGQIRTRTRVLAAAAALLLLFVVQQAVATLETLTAVERERDAWQRPAEVLRALDVHQGDVVVDFGSGAGYFSLKIAPLVGEKGRVLAVDVRRESLAFLWIRAMRQKYWNIDVIHGEVDSPDLPPDPVDAVLIANTYHELARPEPILRALRAAMRPGARLVVVDRSPRGAGESSEEAGDHEISAVEAIAGIQREGFEVASRVEPFIDRSPDGEAWWLVIFRKP